MGRAYARIVLQENRGGTMGKKDRAEYRKQYKESNEKGVYPVVNLVLNWEERPWNGASQ